jgi:hypothetical protein
LQQQKANVEDLQRALHITKQRYQNALHNLESISEEVHVRRQRQMVLSLRQSGGDVDDTQSDLPSINLGENYFYYETFMQKTRVQITVYSDQNKPESFGCEINL